MPTKKTYSASRASIKKKAFGGGAASVRPLIGDGYKHTRTVTTYKYFDNDVMDRAGPHTSAHIFTKLNFEKLYNNKDIRDYRVFLNTRLAPSPGRVNAMLLEKLGRISGREEVTREGRARMLDQYSRLYEQLAATTDRGAQIKMLGSMFELSPQQTYRWDEGSYSKTQIKGKGERRRAADRDSATLKEFGATLEYGSLTGLGAVSALDRWKADGMKSFDYDPSSQSEEDFRRVVRRSVQLVNSTDERGRSWETLSDVSQESNYENFGPKTPASFSRVGRARTAGWLKKG